MNSTDFSLKDLSYVLAVFRTLSFSQAAAACAISQPALSKQIKGVEKALGAPLFERTNRHVQPTETGRLFAEQAQRVLDEADKLLDLAIRAREPMVGPLALGAIASACPYLLPQFVGPLAQAYPQLRLAVREGLTEPLIQALRQGALDAVIAATTVHDDALACLPLYFEPFLLAWGKADAYPPTIATAQIDSRRLLLLEDGHCLKDQTLELCAVRDAHAALNLKATSLETLLHMAAGGLGVAVVPALAVPNRAKLAETLSFSVFADPTIGRTMALYHRASYPRPDAMRRLADFIRERLPESVRLVE